MGKSVVVVSPDQRLGGLTSNGLGWTDSGRKEGSRWDCLSIIVFGYHYQSSGGMAVAKNE